MPRGYHSYSLYSTRANILTWGINAIVAATAVPCYYYRNRSHLKSEIVASCPDPEIAIAVRRRLQTILLSARALFAPHVVVRVQPHGQGFCRFTRIDTSPHKETKKYSISNSMHHLYAARVRGVQSASQAFEFREPVHSKKTLWRSFMSQG